MRTLYDDYWKKKKKEEWTEWWTRHAHGSPTTVFHSHTRCDRVKIIVADVYHGIRTSPEALRIVPGRELGFGTVSNPTHRHDDFKR